MDLITVMAGETYGRLALWQKHPDHPGGEAFVAPGMIVRVAPTDEVLTRINNGLLDVTNAAPTPPWDGYDSASVTDILQRLTDEGDTMRVVIRQYEAAHKTRQAILNPAAPLDPPFPDYDSLTASEIVDRLATMTDEEKVAIRDYETARKNRKTVLDAVGV